MLRLSASFAAVFALTLAACDPGSDPVENKSPQDISEVGEDCAGCLVDLAECSSTAKTEQQFVECRDLFQSCQADRDLDFGSCGSPSKQLACGLCQDRLSRCGDDAEEGDDCETEFDTCRQLLIRSAAFTCAAEDDDADAEASCSDCQRELAACASGADDASVCQNGFAACRDLANLGDECANPTDSEACELCDAQVETCNAQAEEATCTAGRASCVAQLASSPEACPAPTPVGEGGGSGEGGGGEGGGGEGGSGEGGGATPDTTTSGGGTCEHDACVEGDATEATCDACTAEICAADSFCCELAWDSACVAAAAAIDSCGCSDNACVHDTCETGEALDATCNECATTVCAEDDYCCTTAWDTTCTELAATNCGCEV